MRQKRLLAAFMVVLAAGLAFGLAVTPAEASHNCCHTCLQRYYMCAGACPDTGCEGVCWDVYLSCIATCPRVCPF